MKKCSYCGQDNQDTQEVCVGCGTTMIVSAPVIQPQLTDPGNDLVIVGSFSTMEQASLLAARLTAAGIEACIPEDYGAQPFSQVIPLSSVTVRVAAKNREAAEAIAAEVTESEPDASAVGATTSFSQMVPQHRLHLTRMGMHVISASAVLMPLILGMIAHSVRETAALGPVFWLWILFSVGCFVWTRYLVRRERSLARACAAAGGLQVILFLFLFWTTGFPANSRSHPLIPQPTRNSHNW